MVLDSTNGQNALIQAKEFIADKITADIVVTDSLQMKDSVTGEIYCVEIANGEFIKTLGACGGTISSGGESSESGTENIAVSIPVC